MYRGYHGWRRTPPLSSAVEGLCSSFLFLKPGVDRKRTRRFGRLVRGNQKIPANKQRSSRADRCQAGSRQSKRGDVILYCGLSLWPLSSMGTVGEYGSSRANFLNAISTLDGLRTPFLEGGAHRDMLLLHIRNQAPPPIWTLDFQSAEP